MKYVDCEKHAKNILDKAKSRRLNEIFAIVSVGDNPASQSYIKGKIKDCDYCGIPYKHVHIDTEDEFESKIELGKTLRMLGEDDSISAIILQLPLPDGWDEQPYINLIPKLKDVDGLTKTSRFSPCTPEGIVYLLKEELGDLTGKTVLVIGRGKLVGLPLSHMLVAENCTVTIAHSKTKDLESMLGNYDIIVSAVGKPNLIDLSKCNAEMVVDVGINRVNGKLCGDCFNFDENIKDNMLVTPVPKGVGLLTRAILIKHVAKRYN